MRKIAFAELLLQHKLRENVASTVHTKHCVDQTSHWWFLNNPHWVNGAVLGLSLEQVFRNGSETYNDNNPEPLRILGIHNDTVTLARSNTTADILKVSCLVIDNVFCDIQPPLKQKELQNDGYFAHWLDRTFLRFPTPRPESYFGNDFRRHVFEVETTDDNFRIVKEFDFTVVGTQLCLVIVNAITDVEIKLTRWLDTTDPAHGQQWLNDVGNQDEYVAYNYPSCFKLKRASYSVNEINITATGRIGIDN